MGGSRRWKYVLVPVREDCDDCAQSVCVICAPEGRPEPGDQVFVPPHEAEMLKKYEQSPVFPEHPDPGSEPGMVVREYYAAMALGGLLANLRDNAITTDTVTAVAKAAVAFADALCSELNT